MRRARSTRDTMFSARAWTAPAAALVASVVALAGAETATAAAQQSATTLQLQATYHGNPGRTGFTTGTTVTTANVGGLSQAWAIAAGSVISVQPAAVNGVVYWGDWNGNMRATTSAGRPRWSTFLGTTTDPNCSPKSAGVAGSPSVGILNGVQMVWAGGGDGSVAALNAATGQVIWKTSIAPNPGGFVWSSPVLDGGSVFIGVSSFGDCPIVRGEVVKLDAATGAIQGILYTTPSGCLGAGVWSSPAVDGAGALYVTTANAGCTTPLQYAMLKISTATMTLADSWQIPASQRVTDGDWGSAPTLFTATINGTKRSLVGSAAKNGIFYALDSSNLAAGPVWEYVVAKGGDCPQCGNGSIAPAAFDGTSVYVAGGTTTIGGTSCKGSVDALDPATGLPQWQQCLTTGPVLGAVTAVPGLVFVGAGPDLVALASATGAQLFVYREPSGKPFYAPALVAPKQVYIGSTDGTLRAFALPRG